LFVFEYEYLKFHVEFNSQLPHEGGAFYTSSTIDNSRSHYKNAWPPILYALSLWLNAEEFKHENASIAKELQDKFYLIFGKLNHFFVTKTIIIYLLLN